MVGAERHDCVRTPLRCVSCEGSTVYGARFPISGGTTPPALERASCLIEQGRWQHRVNTENEQWRDVGVEQVHYAKHSTRYSQY